MGEDCGPGHEDPRSGRSDVSGCCGGDPSIHFKQGRSARFVDEAAHRADLREHFGQERLSAEAWVHRHDEDEIEAIQNVSERVLRRVGIEGDAGGGPELSDPAQCSAEMGTRFDVHCDDVSTGVDEHLEKVVGIGDHEVNIDGSLCGGAHSLDDEGADRDVRNEVTVHDVDMNPISARGHDISNVVGQSTEVGGEDGGGDRDGSSRAIGPEDLGAHSDSLARRALRPPGN